MGESKRRKGRQNLGSKARAVSPVGPEVKALLEKGQPINVHLLGVAAIDLAIRSLTHKELMSPERHAFRLAFETLDRIRTGEIDPWQCFLCGVEHVGMQAVSVMAVIERALGEPAPNKPGLVAPICHACDSVSTEETRRRVQAAFGLLGLQEGRA